MSVWNKIVNWFGDSIERGRIVKEFNIHAASAWDNGRSPHCLRAEVTSGDSNNKHSFSKWKSGFRIKATGDTQMNRSTCSVIALVILSNQLLVRRLIRCGFDTLEIYGDSGNGYSTPLKELLIPS